MKNLKVLSISEKFILRFVVGITKYENVINTLTRVIDRGRFDYGDVTKETDPVTFAVGRPEVWVTVLCKDLNEGAFIKELIHRL